ncbi:MAG: exosortase/archaeosortase family protein, partial [Thermoplasmata archaeon]|nr:exosortase/archaeosortase family protein [Thermoplasmata archaeon]
YRALDRYIGAGLAVGFFVTWLSNIIRMAITIMVGIAYGHVALVFVHAFIGILIFVACITVFWLLIVRWLDKVEKNGSTRLRRRGKGMDRRRPLPRPARPDDQSRESSERSPSMSFLSFRALMILTSSGA